MKIRIGFVSNSSNTSFCIYGIYIKNDSEDLQEAIRILDLYQHYGQDEDGLYVGKQWSDIKDDETGKQFKDSVKEKIVLLAFRVPISDITLKTHKDGWNNE